MNEQKRVKLTHGNARVDKDCSEETLKALDEMSKLAYEMESKPLNIDSVSTRQSKCQHLNVTNRICNKCKRVITYVPDGC